MAHRGPDDCGLYSDEHIVLARRRLSIIDLSRRARQWLCNEGGNLWISYNGKIYNYKELRSELLIQGHIFKSDSDTLGTKGLTAPKGNISELPAS
jgi:asparagine synthase (glutamine-hydrolysing)